MTDPLISIILPVYKQADHLASVVSDYETALSNRDYAHEIILVVNGDCDASLNVANELATIYRDVCCIHNQEAGWGRAVRTGLQVARGDFLCYSNSARTSSQDLLIAIQYGIANPDAIIKTHRISRETLERRMGSLLFNLLGRVLFFLPTWDINATPKVFSRQVYNSLKLAENGDLIDLEFFIQCRDLKKVIMEIPVYGERRHGGKSTTNYGSAIKMYTGMFKMWRSLERKKKQAR